ncbi:Protein of unknown function [Gryllus bimaculatus]|nr:Protein of unknown function [Gryllus bimaculatus]
MDQWKRRRGLGVGEQLGVDRGGGAGNFKMVVHFKSCCCGCSLKTGTVIIGIFSGERPRMIKPWIVFAILSLTVQSILTVGHIIFYFINGAVIVGVVSLVILTAGIALGVYFILVVNSFHTELLSNNFQNKI